MPPRLLHHRVAVDVGEQTEAEAVGVARVGEAVDDDGGLAGMERLAHPGVQLIVGDGAPEGGLAVHDRLDLHRGQLLLSTASSSALLLVVLLLVLLLSLLLLLAPGRRRVQVAVVLSALESNRSHRAVWVPLVRHVPGRRRLGGIQVGPASAARVSSAIAAVVVMVVVVVRVAIGAGGRGRGGAGGRGALQRGPAAAAAR